jgi:hypothetical protein
MLNQAWFHSCSSCYAEGYEDYFGDSNWLVSAQLSTWVGLIPNCSRRGMKSTGPLPVCCGMKADKPVLVSYKSKLLSRSLHLWDNFLTLVRGLTLRQTPFKIFCGITCSKSSESQFHSGFWCKLGPQVTGAGAKLQGNFQVHC